MSIVTEMSNAFELILKSTPAASGTPERVVTLLVNALQAEV